MAKDPMQRYAESLEKTLQQTFSELKEMVEDFKGLCMVVTPEKHTPQDVITDIRKLYKEIRGRLAEIKAIQQTLQGKYRQYYRRNSLRDKSMMEFGFLTKNLYSKFEYILTQKQALSHQRKREVELEEQRGFPFWWFRSKNNQATFIRNLRILNELDYERPSDPGIEERRKAGPEGVRHLTLFCLKGNPSDIENLLVRFRLREHDLIERFAPDELHGVLAHLREVGPLELEKVFQRILERETLSKLKCLLITVRSSKDLEGDRFHVIKKALEEMEEGKMKTI